MFALVPPPMSFRDARSRRPPPGRHDNSDPDGSFFDCSARELRGVLGRITFHNDDNRFTIARLRASSGQAAGAGDTVKGALSEPIVGLEYHFLGEWKLDPKWGWQFAFSDARPLAPTSVSGIRDYLRAHCPWVGPEVSRAIVEAFGEAALETCKKEPERVARQINGITVDRAKEIQAALLGREHLERVEVEVRGIVAPAGVNARQLRGILERYKGEAAVVVRKNPYRLIDDVSGIDWKTADAIGQAVGIEPASPDRIRAGVVHALKEAENEGHTCVARAELLVAAATLLTLPCEESGAIAGRVSELVAVGELVAYAVEGGGLGMGAEERIYRAELYRAETAIAEAVLRLLKPAPVAPPAPVRAASPASDAEADDEDLEATEEPPPPERADTPRRSAVTRTERWAADALVQLAHLDGDRASVVNGVGFSRFDGERGHRFARAVRNGGLTDNEWPAAVRLAKKYRRQVGEPPGFTETG